MSCSITSTFISSGDLNCRHSTVANGEDGKVTHKTDDDGLAGLFGGAETGVGTASGSGEEAGVGTAAGSGTVGARKAGMVAARTSETDCTGNAEGQ